QQVLYEEPVPPRRLQPRLPADLDTICIKCLDKDAKKRYSTAAGLADDLERYLRDEPIAARPIGWWGRTWKWARRRPAAAALIAVSVLAALLLIAGEAVHESQLQRALAETRSLAEESRARLIQLQVTEGGH